MNGRLYSRRAPLFVLLAGSLLAACESDLTELTEAVGPIAFNFSVGPNASGLPSGTATLVGGNSVRLSLSSLRALASGQYQFWLLGRDAQNLDVVVQGFGPITEFYLRVDTLPDGSPNLNPVTGDTLFVTDSTTISATRAAGYAGSDSPFVTSARVTVDSAADGSNPATYHAVFVTKESSVATEPGAARFLWRRIGVGGNGALSFGNFGGSDVINIVSPRDYVFGPRGAGLGGARGPELSVDLNELARPPIGFFYTGWVANKIGDGVLVDTLRSTWNPETARSRVSLFDADVSDLLPGVLGIEVRNAQVRNCASGSAQNNCQNSMQLPAEDTFVGYENFQFKLEPKGGVNPIRNRSVSLSGTLPEKVK
jgi:hypothetical protein